MSLLKRYRSQIVAWWDEYFTDNPIVWLLHRHLVRSRQVATSMEASQLAKALENARRAGDPDAIQSLQAQSGALLRNTIVSLPFWQWSDLLKTVLAWSVVLLIVLLIHVVGWYIVLQVLRNAVLVWVLLSGLLGVAPFGLGAVPRWLFLQERLQGTDVFLWLTRIEGRHIVFGALTLLVLRNQMRPYLCFIAPFVWLVSTYLCESVLRGVWVTLMVGWWWGTFALFCQIASIFLLPASPTSLSNLLRYGLYWMGAVVLSSVPFVILQLESHFETAVQRVLATPFWQWWSLREWWISLLPSAGIPSTVLVSHPMWGIPQGLVYLGMAYLLLPFAIRFAERARLLMESTPPQEEGW